MVKTRKGGKFAGQVRVDIAEILNSGIRSMAVLLNSRIFCWLNFFEGKKESLPVEKCAEKSAVLHFTVNLIPSEELEGKFAKSVLLSSQPI